jgi:hypothetical protein
MSRQETKYKIEKILIPYIRDSFGGLIAMYNTYGSGLPITDYIIKNDIKLMIYYQYDYGIDTPELFYNKFLKYLLIKKPPSMIDVVKWLTEKIPEINSPDIKNIIYKSVESILNPGSVKYNKNVDIFNTFRAFFMLSYVDNTGDYFYTYKDILEKIEKESARPAAITLAAKLIGAKVGLTKLKTDGLIVSPATEKEINDQLDNIDNVYDLYY